MGKRWLFSAVLSVAAIIQLHAEFVTLDRFRASDDPVLWGDPNAAIPGTVYVSRWGYWQDQPVKMAYWTALPHQKIPLIFQISDAKGKIVYTGHPEWMRNPERVMVPIGFFYPGLKIYALNFSGLDEAGIYFIEVPGYRNSREFRIRGYLPGELRHMPGELSFEREAGIHPEAEK